MRRAEAIEILRSQRTVLAERYGARSLALFGSVARDEARPDSDVDILVEFERPVGLFGLFELQDYLEALLGCKVDLGTNDSLKPRLRQRVLEERVVVTWSMAGAHL
jgi:predicted nucleotidyltransferase